MLSGIGGRILSMVLPVLSERVVLPLVMALFDQVADLVEKTDNEIDNQIFNAVRTALRRVLNEGPDKVSKDLAGGK